MLAESRKEGLAASGEAVGKLRKSRKIRTKAVATVPLAAVVTGPELVHAFHQAAGRPLRESIAVVTGIFASAGVAIHADASRNVKKATYRVGAELCKEAKKNKALFDFLTSHKYVLIDRKGRLVGTNKKAVFGLGRLIVSDISFGNFLVFGTLFFACILAN